MKIAFLHNMTNQMMEPAKAITESVGILCETRVNEHGDTGRDGEISREEAEHQVDVIQQQTKAITDVLNHLLDASDSGEGKEEGYE